MTNIQSTRTLQEVRTSLDPAEVLELAREFFMRRNSIYSAFLERQDEKHLVFRGQGGEEIVIAVEKAGADTRVTGSTYMFDQQIARFFSALPPGAEASAG